jgi:uncharacterized alkaline shock family protein YloU
MEGKASISSEVLARYAADAASEVDGVRGLVASQLHRHRGVRVSTPDGIGATAEIHVEAEWGASIPKLGREVQRAVGDYLSRMARAAPAAVNVVVDAVGPAR